MTEHRGRRVWMMVVGAVVLVVTVVASVLLWAAGGRRFDDNVAGFARAPVGCDTTLDFERSGSFVLFIETTGEFDHLAGACDAATSYDRDDRDRLRPELAIVGPDGDGLELEPAGEVAYDTDGFVGTSYLRVQIETPGDHVLTVPQDDGGPFAIAVGRDPNEGTALLRVISVAVAIIGVAAAAALLLLGSRRPAPTPTPSDAWAPDGATWPSSPPGFPAPPPTTGAEWPAGPPAALPSAPTWSGRPPLESAPPTTSDASWGPPRPG